MFVRILAVLTLLVASAFAATTDGYVVDQDYKFSITAPAAMKVSHDSGEASGIPYTCVGYDLTIQGGNYYVGAAAYKDSPATLADVGRIEDAFVTQVKSNFEGSVVLTAKDQTIDGQAGRFVVIRVTSKPETQVLWVGTFKGNRLYQVMYTYVVGQPTDNDAVSKFFLSFTMN
jgi:hypothetical protein